MAESSLYERLGGAFAIAAVIDHFSDAVVRNPIAGQESPRLGRSASRAEDLSRRYSMKSRLSWAVA
jgi:hemoglobin